VIVVVGGVDLIVRAALLRRVDPAGRGRHRLVTMAVNVPGRARNWFWMSVVAGVGAAHANLSDLT
jgi:hypothetical protein